MSRTIKIVTKVSDILAMQLKWDELREKNSQDTVFCQQYLHTIQAAEIDSPFVIVVYDNTNIVAIVPCVLASRKKRFIIARYKLFEINYRVIQLTGGVVGDIPFEAAAEIVRHLSARRDCDAVNLYEHPVESSLYQAFSKNDGLLNNSPYIKDVNPHWIIDFPDSIDDYMLKFKSKKRKYLRWMIRDLNKKYDVRLETMTGESQISGFLKDASSVSKKTYQWGLGAKLIDSSSNAELYKLLARKREFRSYILYLNDQPVAFVKSKIINNVFHYESTGYLSEYSKASPGTILLLLIFENLIESRQATRLDFGSGGDFTGYKSIYGTMHYDSARIEAYTKHSVRAWLIFLVEVTLWNIKRASRKVKKLIKFLKLMIKNKRINKNG